MFSKELEMDLINSNALRSIIREELPDVSNNLLTKKDAKSLIKKYASQGYFNVGDAANYCGVSRSTFDKWRKDGIITPRIVCGVVRYARADLDKMMSNDEMV